MNRISSPCSVNFPKVQGVHGAGLRAMPRKRMRYTSVVIFRSLRLVESPKRVKTSRGSLWRPEAEGQTLIHFLGYDLRGSGSIQREVNAVNHSLTIHALRPS